MNRRTFAFFAAVAAACLLSPARAEDDLAPQLRAGLVKIHATSQGWQIDAPWNKTSPGSGVQRGVMVRPGLVLTPVGGLANCIMVEVSEANSARRYPASLAHIDYGANLALVKIEDPELGKRLAPLPMGDPITIDDEFEIWQLGASDLLERSTGRVQAVTPSGVRLELTVKTTLGDNGDGQVALRDGSVVGLVTRTQTNRQEGTLTAVETIRHFLDDYDTGKYRGFGIGPLFTHKLMRDDLRAHYGVPEGVHGLGVSRVIPGRTGDGVLEVRDVIVSIRGYALDDEGMFVHEKHGRLDHGFLLYGETHPGDEVDARILRDGKEMDVKVPIRGWPYEEQRVPADILDRRPPYLVIGGLVLFELSRRSSAGGPLAMYRVRAAWDPPDDRRRIVYASRVLADAANKGIDELGNLAVQTVNGRRITKIADVAEALKTPSGDFHVIVFEGIASPFVIEAAKLDEIDKRIAERYRIAELRFLE